MAVIKSKLKTASAEFKAAAEAMRGQVAELNERLAVVRQGGGDAAKKKHQGRGKLLPRERVAALLDPGTPFLELSRTRGVGGVPASPCPPPASSPASAG